MKSPSGEGKTEQSRFTKRQIPIQVDLSQPQISICPQYCPAIPLHILGIFATPFPKFIFTPLQTPALPWLLPHLIWALNFISYWLLTDFSPHDYAPSPGLFPQICSKDCQSLKKEDPPLPTHPLLAPSPFSTRLQKEGSSLFTASTF